MRRAAPTALLASLFALSGAANAVVVNSLPFNNSPDWTIAVNPGTSMILGGGQTVLSTADNTGVWFGNGTVYGDTPSWRPGTSATGNEVDLTASFSSNARDWSVYLYDRTHFAGIEFAPTGCDGNAGSCYSAPALAGVMVAHASVGNPGQFQQTFVPVSLGQAHRYEFLLKDGLVRYRIDGVDVFSGTAYVSAPAAFIAADGLLVIGDGSGSTRTGTGSMTVHAVSINTAPVGVVPEPGTAAMLAGGLLALLLRSRARRT